MKTKNLFIVRHGQTDYNKNRMVQGSGIDAPLNETGRMQAETFYQAYKTHPFDKVYVSSLIRTRQSVSSFIDGGIPFDTLSGLNEISWGKQEGLPFDEVSHQNYLSVTDGWSRGDLELRVGGGETPIEVMKRQVDAFKHIMAQTHEEEVLICMHGRAMRVLLCWMLNYPLKNMDYFVHDNLFFYQLSYTGSFFSVTRFNEGNHLS
ncbi:MAG: histidine phosphatase family protein [Cyclobacteriaceae bacterium]